MNFNLFYQLKNNQAQFIDVIFYIEIALLTAAVFCYGIFTFKIYLQDQQIAQLDEKIAVYGTAEQMAIEQKILNYKQQIDDFTIIINNHKIAGNVFAFIEEHTLSKVWFSNVSILLEDKNEVNLLGESQDLETLSNQVNIFETNKEYIKNVTVINSQTTDQGKIKFTLILSLNPEIFKNYQNVTLEDPITNAETDTSNNILQNL